MAKTFHIERLFQILVSNHLGGLNFTGLYLDRNNIQFFYKMEGNQFAFSELIQTRLFKTDRPLGEHLSNWILGSCLNLF